MRNMFGKSDLVDDLSRDLSRARDKRDALASDVTTLSAQISELEARFSAENDRRERERVEGEIEGLKERLKDFYLMFAKAIVGMRDVSVGGQSHTPLGMCSVRVCSVRFVGSWLMDAPEEILPTGAL